MKIGRLCLLLLAAAPGVFAQSGSSVIVGRVTSQGTPLASAAVRIDSDSIQNTRLTLTTTRGTYWAAALPPGTYRITFSHAGTQTVTRKALVRGGETVRVDAELVPSEEGESVTMTTITRSIMERPDIVSSVEPETVDGLPIAPEISSRIALAPGVRGRSIRGSQENLYVIDGVYQLRRGADTEIEDALADAEVIDPATSPEWGRFSGGVVLATTCSGGNDLTASIRETLTGGGWSEGGSGGILGKTQATVGGKIVRDALWTFLAGETGRQLGFGRQRSGLAKVTASPGTRATLSVTLLRASTPDESRASGDGLLIVSRRALIEGHADTSRVGAERERHESLNVHSLVPTRFGDHAFVAGGEEYGSERAVFAGDSWSDGVRWVISGGLRYDTDRGTSPRAGIAYDVAGDGHARLAATWARYAGPADTARETALTWAQRVLTSGFARVTLVHRSYDRLPDYRAVELEARADYLFLTVGGSASLARGMQEGAAWVTATAPAVEQHFTLALVERVRSGAATDLSLHYRFSRHPVEPFVKLDLLNAFDRRLTVSEDPLGARRALRLSFGARM